jgi:hypothetical protein
MVARSHLFQTLLDREKSRCQAMTCRTKEQILQLAELQAQAELNARELAEKNHLVCDAAIDSTRNSCAVLCCAVLLLVDDGGGGGAGARVFSN